MAELLARGWNVAVPEVDVGDDIFVVRDRDGNLSRVQVKTANTRERSYGYSAVFSLSYRQLRTPISPELTYVLATRRGGRWESFVVIDRKVLDDEHQLHAVGSLTEGNKVMFQFAFSGESVTSSGRDFTSYLNNWARWPLIRH